jgi:hypothetical protein
MSDGADAPHLEELRARAPALHAIALITTLDSGVATAAVTAALVRLLSQRQDAELQAGEAARRALDGALADLPGIASQSDRGLPLDRVDADDLGEGLDLLRVTTRALTALDPVQRKVLAAWAYDDVALDPGAERSALEELGVGLAALPWTPTAEEALHRFVEAEPAPADLLDRALAVVADRRRRTRRRWLFAGVATAVVIGAVAFRLDDRRDPGLATGEASVSASGSVRPIFTVGGVRVRVAVAAADEAKLPVLPNTLQDTGITPRLGIPDGDIPALAPGLIGTRSVRAILIRRLPDGTGRAVLNVPRGNPDYVDVPAIVIPPARPGFAAVGPRSISRDRHRIVLPSANGVVVVNVLTAEMLAFPADLSQAESVGFSSDESSIVLSSLGNPQRIVLATGDVQTMAPPGDAGRFRLVVDAAPNLLGFDGRGGAVAQYAVGGPINGFGSPTVTSQSGWSAAATVFNAAIMPAHAGQGILAVTVDVSPSATALVLAQADDRGDATPCCSALAWAPSDRALYLSASPTVWRILAWDVHSGEQFRVSELPTPDERSWFGEFTL